MTNIIWNERHLTRELNFNRPWYKPALELATSVTTANNVVIEVGAGCGEFANLLYRANAQLRYIGFDGNSENLVIAHESGFSAIWADFEKPIPIASSSVDLVVSLEVIEHVANAEKMLAEFFRILKPAGHLILSTPNIGFLVHRIRYLLYAEVLQEGIHLRFFNQKRLQRATTQVGFDFLQQRSCMPLFGYNTLARYVGRQRRFIATPTIAETWLSTNFIWLLKKRE